MSDNGGSSDNDEFNLNDQEERRAIRTKLKATSEFIAAHKQDLRNVNSNVFAETMDMYHASAQGTKTRELQSESGILQSIAVANAGRWNGLCDKSARFSWMDFVDSLRAKFVVANEPFNWEKAGGEARMLFNCVPSFNTMVGPIHKEEKFRKMAVRRVRTDTSEVVTTTGLVIENNEEDGNDEATNARVDKLLGYLTSFEGQNFDLLRTLVDPSNPVQSVENFFDFAYLHKGKRVRHEVDQETGLLKGTLTGEEELEHCKKSQMVLSFSMRDMEDMAHILYPEYFQQQQDGSTGASSSSRSNAHPMRHPLHRDDPLYQCASAAEQVKLLAERAAQQQKQQASQKASQNPRGRSQGAASATQGSSRMSGAAAGGSGASGGGIRAGRSSAPAASSSSSRSSAHENGYGGAPHAGASSSSAAPRSPDMDSLAKPAARAHRYATSSSNSNGRARVESPSFPDSPAPASYSVAAANAAASRGAAGASSSAAASAGASSGLGKRNRGNAHASPEDARSGEDPEDDYFNSDESEEHDSKRKAKGKAGGRRSYV